MVLPALMTSNLIAKANSFYKSFNIISMKADHIACSKALPRNPYSLLVNFCGACAGFWAPA